MLLCRAELCCFVLCSAYFSADAGLLSVQRLQSKGLLKNARLCVPVLCSAILCSALLRAWICTGSHWYIYIYIYIHIRTYIYIYICIMYMQFRRGAYEAWGRYRASCTNPHGMWVLRPVYIYIYVFIWQEVLSV